MAFILVGSKKGYILTDIHGRMYDPFLEKIVLTQEKKKKILYYALIDSSPLRYVRLINGIANIFNI